MVIYLDLRVRGVGIFKTLGKFQKMSSWLGKVI